MSASRSRGIDAPDAEALRGEGGADLRPGRSKSCRWSS